MICQMRVRVQRLFGCSVRRALLTVIFVSVFISAPAIAQGIVEAENGLAIEAIRIRFTEPGSDPSIDRRIEDKVQTTIAMFPRDRFSREVLDSRASDPATAQIPNMGMLKTQSLLMYADSRHRQATPAEQASVILFLLSDEASNITGAAWATDGGWTAF